MSYGPMPLDPAETDFPRLRCPECGSMRNRTLGALNPQGATMARGLDCPASMFVRNAPGPEQNVQLVGGLS